MINYFFIPSTLNLSNTIYTPGDLGNAWWAGPLFSYPPLIGVGSPIPSADRVSVRSSPSLAFPGDHISCRMIVADNGKVHAMRRDYSANIERTIVWAYYESHLSLGN